MSDAAGAGAAVLEQLPCAVLVTDGEGRVLACNHELRALFAAPAQVQHGAAMETLFSGASQIFLQTHVWPLLFRQERVYEIFLQVQPAPGQTLPVMVNGRLGLFAGAPCYFWTLFVARERERFESALVASRQRAEAAVREQALAHQQLHLSKQALEQAQRLGRIGSWSWQLDSGLVTWSKELFVILGCDPVAGAPTLEAQSRLYQPDDFGRLQALVRVALECHQPYRAELAYIRPDGVTGWVEAIGEVVLDGSGRLTGLQGTVQDITERRGLDLKLSAKREELKRSNQELERFAYVASHDLQEPLRMVTSYGQLLLRRHQADLNSEAQVFLNYMVDGGVRAQALIKDLLSLARLDSQAQAWQPVAMQGVVADALKMLRLRVQETGAIVTQDELPTLSGDASQLRQLMLNLLGNALKFCGAAKPRVHIGASREGSAWRIAVRDNGIGIDPRHFERIFQMFQRLHLRTAFEGTGIGLAICKKVVESHGGTLAVASSPGEGACFHFTIPDPVQVAQAQPGRGQALSRAD